MPLFDLRGELLMAKSKLGIGSFAYRYQVGIPAFRPPNPMTPIDFIDHAGRLGLKRIQLCENIGYADCDERAIAAMVKHAKNLGLTVELGMYGLTRENIRKHLRLAGLFESKFIRVVIGGLHDDHDKAVHIASENIQAVLDECRGEGVHIGLENHFDLTASDIVEIIQEVDDPLVGSIFDSTNGIFFLERPEQTLGIMMPYIKSVHLKDFRMLRTEAGITMAGQVLGQGSLETESILRKVMAQNPEASIIIELTIRRKDGLSVTEVIETEKEQIARSVYYAQQICDRL
jgi:sugar phosphate isomerase/epimerase